jgi:hypothetical protein
MRAAKMASEVSRLRMDRELQDAAGTIPNTDRQAALELCRCMNEISMRNIKRIIKGNNFII